MMIGKAKTAPRPLGSLGLCRRGHSAATSTAQLITGTNKEARMPVNQEPASQRHYPGVPGMLLSKFLFQTSTV
jgi:hypothetical protein